MRSLLCNADIHASFFKKAYLVVFTTCLTAVYKFLLPSSGPQSNFGYFWTKLQVLEKYCRFESIILCKF